MTFSIKSLAVDAESAWDEFVASCSEATFFHRSGWKTVIERAFAHPTYYRYACTDDGRIAAVLPLVEIKSALFGHSLVSTPFCVYGGIASNDPEATQLLLEDAKQLAETLGVDYLELRHRTPKADGWLQKQAHATFVKTLDEDDEANMLAMKRKQRAVVRQGIKNEHETELNADLDTFYKLYSTSVRNLGTPVFSRKYFRTLKAVFGDDCEILTINHQGQATSSLMTFFHGDQVLPYYAGSIPESRQLKSMDFMYWDQMCRENAKGQRVYDFGRSKIDSGPYNYKRHFGFEPQPLCYEYHLVKAQALPDLNPNNPKYSLFIKGWQKLPLKVSQLVGPLLSKHLG